jgi:nucleotide-binding universal stress UspA family protein
MLKDVLVNLSVGTIDDGARDFAISVARQFDLHLAGVAFAVEPIALAMDGGPPEWLDQLMREAEVAADSAVTRFDEAIRGSGVLAESHRITTSVAGSADLFGRMARRYDVSIIRQTNPEEVAPSTLMIEAALFNSGRPIFVVPYVHGGAAEFDRGLVCWDGSRNAARAVGDAVPLLQRAKSVELVIVSAQSKNREIPGADIARHLARHGITVEIKEIIAPDVDAGNIILSHATDIAADFMVMGGYGHSRLRELIFGGVTRSILGSMTLPTFMSH